MARVFDKGEGENPPDIEKMLQTMLDNALEGIVTRLNSYVDQVTLPLNESVQQLSQQLSQQQPAQPSQEAQDDPVQARLKMLEEQLSQAEQRRLDAEKQQLDTKRNGTLSALLNEHQLVNRSVLEEYLGSKLSSAKYDNGTGEFLTKDGKKMKEFVNEFLSSDQGKHFLAADVPQGLGTKTGRHKDIAGNTKPENPWLALEANLRGEI